MAAVGERYRQQQDLLSLVLLYEATQAELDMPGLLGRDNVAMVRLQRQAADAFSVLETAQANLVRHQVTNLYQLATMSAAGTW